MRCTVTNRSEMIANLSSPEAQARLLPLRRQVEERAAGQHTTFMGAVFQLLAEAQQAEQKPVACQKGCSACCRQLVTCFSPEFEEIVRHIGNLPRDKKNRLLSQIRPRVKLWKNYRKLHGRQIVSNPFKPLNDWYGKPCIFLDNGSCGIYPARPMDCRTTHSTVRCQWDGDKLKPPPHRLFFSCDTGFNNLVIEEAARTQPTGRFGVTALPDWVLVRFPGLCPGRNF